MAYVQSTYKSRLGPQWRSVLGFLQLTYGLGMGLGRYNRNTFVSVEAIIINNLDLLFGGMEIQSAHVFRTTRNADVARNEEEAEDLLEMITDEVRMLRSYSFFTIAPVG